MSQDNMRPSSFPGCFSDQNIIKHPLSHNNPCFQCNIAITNFIVSHTCEIRFHDIIGQSTVHVFLCKNSKTWLTYMAK